MKDEKRAEEERTRPHITSTVQLVAVGGVGADPDEMWFACEHPERPPDKNTMHHILPDCHGCIVAMEANVRRLCERAGAQHG